MAFIFEHPVTAGSEIVIVLTGDSMEALRFNLEIYCGRLNVQIGEGKLAAVQTQMVIENPFIFVFIYRLQFKLRSL